MQRWRDGEMERCRDADEGASGNRAKEIDAV